MSEPESKVNYTFGLAPSPTPIAEQALKCPLCLDAFREPKVLACFHSFCGSCLEPLVDDGANDRIICPQCQVETELSSSLGINSLLNDYGLENMLQRQKASSQRVAFDLGPSGSSSSTSILSDLASDQNGNPRSTCTGCKSSERARAFCQDCCHFLCASCVSAHKRMHCFEGHQVDVMSPGSSSEISDTAQCMCIQHNSRPLRFFCLTCDAAICVDCAQEEHVAPTHHYELIDDVAEKQVKVIETLLQDARKKQLELLESFKEVDVVQDQINVSSAQIHNKLDDLMQTLGQIIEDAHVEATKEIEEALAKKQTQLAIINKKMQQVVEKLAMAIEFSHRLVSNGTPAQIMVFKQLLLSRLQMLISINTDLKGVLGSGFDVDLPAIDIESARQQIKSFIGPIQMASSGFGLSVATAGLPPTPIGRPPSRQLARSRPGLTLAKSVNYSDSNLLRLKKEFGCSSQSVAALPRAEGIVSQYENWSVGFDPTSSVCLPETSDLEVESSAKEVMEQPLKRQKMIYYCKFGEFGVKDGQFTEPSGVTVNPQNDIIVADTNNHRIQVFDKVGHFKFQFGECGKRNGQLLYPNRVAVNRMTGDFVVTERAPTHQIQIYNQYGQFVRKFGAGTLLHPRAVCVDSHGLIIVVECKIMRVIMFDSRGTMIQKFSCNGFLEFPNGVCTSSVPEIYISDNRAHCIKVFSYEGQFLRRIGGEGITNYPIGVGINSHGEIVVADNHNNFNLTVFSQDGRVISALESKVKHAQCFDMALTEDGSVVVASRDFRLYVYRYQSPSAVYP